MKKPKFNIFSLISVKNDYSIFGCIKIFIISIIFYFSFFHSKLFAWHDTGHMIVANIAYKNLEPNLAKKLDKLLQNNSKDYPTSNNFITSSVWADDIKIHGFNFFNTWHYQDSYFSTDGTPLPKPYNSGKAFYALKKHLSLVNNEMTTDYEKVFALRFIIHIIGDLHQPMHNISRVTSEFPRGDLGGNFFKLNDEKYSNLHSLWDSGLKLLPEFKRPLSDNKSSWMSTYSEELMALYPLSSFSKDIMTASYKQWQGDNIELVETYVYTNIEPNTRPNENYLTNNQEIIKKQLVLAGYRLANVLNCTFDTNKCIK